jgi:aromatic-L-amino-acid decarboxylase
VDPETFRRLGHELIDWIADYRQGVAERPVMSQVQPGEIKQRFPGNPPQEAESLDDLFAKIEHDILPGLSHWQHPRFFGYFPANAPLESVLGDYLSTGLGVLGLSWQASPALTELEELTTDWVRQMVGLSDAWHGAIQDTASTATLVALICARERATGYSLAGGGLQGEPRPLVVYASRQAHSSAEKAALLAGFGRDNLRWVETDAAQAMRPGALATAVAADIERGLLPCAVVATVGTTATTALDPIAPIAAVAAEHGLWLHVDAAMAGSAMILPSVGGCGRGSKVPTRSSSTPTSGSAPRSTAPSPTCATPST